MLPLPAVGLGFAVTCLAVIQELRAVWLPLPLRRILGASRFQFVIHGQGLRVFYLRLRRRVEDRPRGELVEVEGVVLELGTPEVCNSEDCQRGFANATPARSADLIALIGIQLTGLESAKQKRRYNENNFF